MVTSRLILLFSEFFLKKIKNQIAKSCEGKFWTSKEYFICWNENFKINWLFDMCESRQEIIVLKKIQQHPSWNLEAKRGKKNQLGGEAKTYALGRLGFLIGSDEDSWSLH